MLSSKTFRFPMSLCLGARAVFIVLIAALVVGEGIALGSTNRYRVVEGTYSQVLSRYDSFVLGHLLDSRNSHQEDGNGDCAFISDTRNDSKGNLYGWGRIRPTEETCKSNVGNWGDNPPGASCMWATIKYSNPDEPFDRLTPGSPVGSPDYVACGDWRDINGAGGLGDINRDYYDELGRLCSNLFMCDSFRHGSTNPMENRAVIVADTDGYANYDPPTNGFRDPDGHQTVGRGSVGSPPEYNVSTPIEGFMSRYQTKNGGAVMIKDNSASPRNPSPSDGAYTPWKFIPYGAIAGERLSQKCPPTCAPQPPQCDLVSVNYNTSSVLAKVGEPISALGPTVAGTTGALNFGVAPSLPAGLVIDSQTGVISGTPEMFAQSTDYTVTMTDSRNCSDTATVTIRVMDDGSTSNTGNPAVISWTLPWEPNQRQIDIFARDSNNNLITKWWNGTEWNGWANLGGNLASDPSVVSWKIPWETNQRAIDIFARDTDNSVIHKWWNGTQWIGWENLGGNVTGNLAVVSWTLPWEPNKRAIDIFARDSNNALITKWWDGTQWNGWANLGGNLASDPVVTSWTLPWETNQRSIDIFARDSNNALITKWWNGTQWNGWANLGGNLAGDPAAVSWTIPWETNQRAIDIFARDSDNSVAHKWWNGTQWIGWEDLGGNLADDETLPPVTDPDCDPHGNQFANYDFDMDTPITHRDHGMSSLTGEFLACGTAITNTEATYEENGSGSQFMRFEIEAPPGVWARGFGTYPGAYFEDFYAGNLDANLITWSGSPTSPTVFQPNTQLELRVDTGTTNDCPVGATTCYRMQTTGSGVSAHGSVYVTEDSGIYTWTIGELHNDSTSSPVGISKVNSILFCRSVNYPDQPSCDNGTSRVSQRNGDVSTPDCNGGNGPEGIYTLTGTNRDGQVTAPSETCVAWYPSKPKPRPRLTRRKP